MSNNIKNLKTIRCMLIELAIKKCMVLQNYSHLVYYWLNALRTKFPEGIKSTSYMKRIIDA